MRLFADQNINAWNASWSLHRRITTIGTSKLNMDQVHLLPNYPCVSMPATFAEILSVLPAISKGTCRATQEKRSVPYAGHLIHRQLIRLSIWQNTTRVLGIPKIGICKELEDFGIGKTRSTYIKNHLI
nr:PREDICTED: uncharacterized protein LOC109042999 [Bemisia tabaci]